MAALFYHSTPILPFNNYLCGSSQNVPVCMTKTSPDQSVKTSPNKTSPMNTYFASTCVKDNGTLPPFNKRIPAGAEFDNVTFTPENVLRVLRKLKSSKSSGPDGFPSHLFKKLASHLAFPLSMLFNNSMSVGKIPAECKNLIITPVAKGGLASDVG